MFRKVNVIDAIYNAITRKNKHGTPAEVKKSQLSTDKAPKQKKEIGQGKQHWPLSQDLMTQVNKMLSATAVEQLAQSSRFLYHSSKPFFKAYKDELKLLLPEARTLASRVIINPSMGNKKSVIDALMENPKLLHVKIPKTTMRRGRIIINKTLFQLAYGARDDDFCEAMKAAFIKLYDGNETTAIAEMAKQRDEIRETKEEEEKHEIAIKANLARLLAPVIAAIDEFRTERGWIILNKEMLNLITKFRIDFANSQPQVIDKGPHFRSCVLDETFAAFEEAAKRWGYDHDRFALFEDIILSTILSHVPDNDAMRFSQGLHFLQKEKKPEPFKRSFTLSVGGNQFYEAVTGPSVEIRDLVGSSVDIALGCQARTALTDDGYLCFNRNKYCSDPTLSWCRRVYQKLCETRTTNLENLFIQQSKPTQKLG